MFKSIVFTTLLGSFAYAAPTIYSTNLTILSQLNNNTNSNLIADSVDQNKVYVMPPSVASATVSGLHTLTANLGFCKEMAADQKYSLRLAGEINELLEKEVESKIETDKIQKELFAARAHAAEFTVQARLGDLADIDATIESADLRLSELFEKANTCKNFCEQVNAELDILVKNKKELLKLRREITKVHAADVREYERRKAKVVNLTENLNELLSSWAKLSARVRQVKEDFTSMYSTFGRMEGARAKISINSNWDDNVAKLRSENPGIEFTKIQTQNAQVMSNIADIKSLPTDAAILNYEVGGQNINGALMLPSYPESLAGNIRLSLIGACPVLHPDWFEVNLPNGTDQMKYGLTISYEYPTIFNVNATAKYNMYKMYEKIISSGTSGGFFRSRSWSTVQERNEFKDFFSVKWDEQDPSVSLSEEQKAEIEAEMRKHIFDRIANLALPQAPDRGAIVQAAGVPMHGSVVLADSLTKACPMNAYCVGASIALNVLDAIFGSSSSAANYIQTYNFESTEEFSTNKLVFKPAISSYQ